MILCLVLFVMKRCGGLLIILMNCVVLLMSRWWNFIIVCGWMMEIWLNGVCYSGVLFVLMMSFVLMFCFFSWFSYLNLLLSIWIWIGLNNNSLICRICLILFLFGKLCFFILVMKWIVCYISFIKNISRYCGFLGRKSFFVLNCFFEMKMLLFRIWCCYMIKRVILICYRIWW